MDKSKRVSVLLRSSLTHLPLVHIPFSEHSTRLHVLFTSPYSPPSVLHQEVLVVVFFFLNVGDQTLIPSLMAKQCTNPRFILVFF